MRRPSFRRLPAPRQPSVSTPARARSSIAARLRWSLLLSSTLPLLIVGALLLSINLRAQQNSVYSDQIDLAKRVELDVSRRLEQLRSQLDQFALQVRPSTTPTQLRGQATDLVNRNYPDILDLVVLDGQGLEQLHLIKLLVLGDDSLGSRADDPQVQRALRFGAADYSPIALNDDGVRSFVVTLPIRNDANTIVGVLRAELSAEPLARDLSIAIANLKSYPYLVRAEDGSVLLDDGAAGFSAPRNVGALLGSEAEVAQYDGARNQQVIGARAPVLIGSSKEDTGWIVVVEQPVATAFGSLRNSIFLLGMLVILVGVLALGWAFRQARQFLRPLEALRVGATALGAGQLSYRIQSLGDDEMGELARTFNSMAEHLQETQAEIERRNERLRRSMALARDIQIGLLPDRPPWNGEEIAVYARSLPAYEVGGDFYSYLAMSEGRAAVAIGDISGKGVGAALLMALTSSAVESQGRQIEHPAQVLTALNNLLAPRLRANHMNAALLFLVIDPRDQTLRVANAGMIAPLLVSGSRSELIEVGGLPLGSFAGALYHEQVVRFKPGDLLLLISDGVVEAHGPGGELFGFERLEQTIAEVGSADVRDLVEVVLARVQEHMGTNEQHDDITIVAVRPGIVSEHDSLPEEQSISYATI
jgi:serine phosphatase RsbU (regulator of sigma subunit)